MGILDRSVFNVEIFGMHDTKSRAIAREQKRVYETSGEEGGPHSFVEAENLPEGSRYVHSI